MKALLKLYLVKGRAKVRNIFSTPSSAIITGLAVLMYAFSILQVLLFKSDALPMDGETRGLITLIVLGISFALAAFTMVSDKKSFFFKEDAYFIFTGPFTNKQILRYLTMDMVVSSLVMALISLFGVAPFRSYDIALSFPLILFAASAMVQYIFLTLSYRIYLKGMIRGVKSKLGLAIPLVAALCLLAVAGYEWLNAGQDAAAALAALLSGDALNYVPVLGWARMAVLGVYQPGAIQPLVGWLLLLGSCIGLSYIFVGTKGEFYEQAMIDAEKFSEYYQKAKEGKTDDSPKKVRDTSLAFGRHSKAIFSKNLLIARKKGSFIRLRELGIVMFYLAICRLMEINYYAFAGMMLFYIFGTLGTASFMDDLKHHYIYLIPGRALPKLLNSLAVPALQSMAICAIGLVAGGLVLGAAAPDMALATLMSCSFVALFVVGYVLSVRVMRAQNNILVEQTLRMLVALLSLLPTALITYGVYLLAGGITTALVLCVLTASNVAVCGLLLAVCAPMMNTQTFA